MLSCLYTELLFKHLLIFLCLCVPYVHMCCLFDAQGGQKRSLGALELELHMVLNHHVDAGNQA